MVRFVLHYEDEPSEQEDDMSIASHIQELRRKHDHLSTLVEQELKSPASDELKIADMKRQKLRLKEEITRLSTH